MKRTKPGEAFVAMLRCPNGCFFTISRTRAEPPLLGQAKACDCAICGHRCQRERVDDELALAYWNLIWAGGGKLVPAVSTVSRQFE